ncbi:MAG: hypothetical protein ABIM88_00745 [candidate division WOR-3 bacterium]
MPRKKRKGGRGVRAEMVPDILKAKGYEPKNMLIFELMDGAIGGYFTSQTLYYKFFYRELSGWKIVQITQEEWDRIMGSFGTRKSKPGADKPARPTNPVQRLLESKDNITIQDILDADAGEEKI